MINCPQTDTQNVLEHGYAVHAQYCKLIQNPPELLADCWPWFLNQINQYSPENIYTYHIYHDCGKPFCLTYDESGRRHFPQHAKTSYYTWLKYSDNELIANWILHDMDIHLISAEQVPEFFTLEGSAILLLTGLAEIEANAAMFGGRQSISYKSKYSQWKRRAKAYCKLIPM